MMHHYGLIPWVFAHLKSTGKAQIKTRSSEMDNKRSFFAPVKSWKYLFKKPVTISLKDIFDHPRVSPDNARGFHTNDWEKCIGCGTCSEICPTKAIQMVKREELGEAQGKHAERPTIDYGRCCFCALCVDICTTGSLNMTKEYLYNSTNPEDYYLMPGEKGAVGYNGQVHALGYQRTEDSDLLDLKRAEMELMGESRKDSFIEIVRGYSKEQAIIEASRCVGCEICTKTCPAHMNIPQYINAIWKGDFEEALEYVYKTNPLPGVCGSICTHTCETVCSIGHRGEPISIRWLKRYIVDNTPDETYEKVLASEVSAKGNGKVAIVGGGPSGLSASYYLKTLGYEVEVFEEKALVGGVVRYGAPIYRLPEERLNKDTDLLTKIGVKFHTNVKVGKDISLEALRDQYDAVYLATGFPISRSLKMENIEHKDVKYAMDLLAETRDYQRGSSQAPDVAKKSVVIGGGNVAFDVARTLLRLQNERYGTSDVSMMALESREILPADLEEVEEGEEEGLKYYFGYGPQGIVVDEKGIKGLKGWKVNSIFDAEKRFNPSYNQEDEILVEGTEIYVAIGQMNEHIYFTEDLNKNIEFVRGKIKVSENGQIEKMPWLFAGGDIVEGPDIIHGIANGHAAAVGIDAYLSKK